ncbi:Multidrug resistance-associated protein 1 [Linnemannia exigua]|uniref:Multidrug resistance-associated protein 1 n=1 Tax=Linnemannia exigua TaxID=604196 RepID=A0AAD4DAS5_9FUNG|nr:Multidrug resistance-associated protein 1 [Linnemannia exigua]
MAWILSLTLNHFESLYKIRASPFIFCYSFISLVAAAIVIRTLKETNHSEQDPFRALVAFFAFNCAHFAIECWPRGRLTAQKNHPAGEYEKANFFSRITFHFMQPIVSLGYKRPLVQEDIDSLMPKEMQAEQSHLRLSTRWNAKKIKCADRDIVPSLMKTILFSFKAQWVSMTIIRVLSSIMTYVSPQLLNSLLGFIQSYTSPNEADHKPVALGIILAFGMFFTSLLVTFLNTQLTAMSTNLGIEVRTALMSMIYRKALRLSNSARQKSTAGEITNHMSVDAERWSMSLPTVITAISIPLEIGIATWMLYELIGWSIFVGIAAVILMLPIHAKLAGFFQTFRASKMKAMDIRLRLVNEVLGGMKIVKLYNWEEPFKDRIAVVRKNEIELLKRFGLMFSFVGLAFTSTPLIITLVSLAVYATHGGPGAAPGDMNPQTIFVSISLFGLLSKPISAMSSTLNHLTSITVATTRMQKFLLAEELDETVIERELQAADGGEEDDCRPVIEVKDSAVFAWCPEQAPVETEKQRKEREKEEAKKQKALKAKAKKESQPIPEKKLAVEEQINYSPTLTNINLSIAKGSLTAIVGRVGQGKTSLLSALIGEMYKRQGSVRIRGRVAYVAQQAWIVNMTLRDNITFGLEFDQEKYDRIVAASGLLPDIEMLPAGDQTEIGERGINLSGGQKQRVSLARSAYQDADVYLLDDPLSAVDAHVDQHLWENLIGPNGLLKDKTRVLVTHGIHHLEHFDQIVVVKDGQITDDGHYDDLMASKGAFYQLIDEYSINAHKDRHKKNKKSAKADDEIEVECESAESEEDDTSLEGEDEDKKSEADTEKGDEKAIVKNVDLVTKKDEKAAELIAAEKMVMGRVSWNVYRIYLRAASYRNSVFCVFMYLLVQACQIGTNLWLQHWTTARPGESRSPSMFLGVYATITVVYMILMFFFTYALMVWVGVRATIRLHDGLLSSIMRLPMSFFDTTPLGRIVNRFSTDIFATDNAIPWSFMSTLMCGVSVLGTVVVIAATTPIFLAIVPPLAAGFVLVQMYYIRPSRSLKRIDSTSRSPVYQHFTETLIGVSTIRAMGIEERFIMQNEKATISANAYFTYMMVSRWLQIRLETLGACLVLGAGLFAVLDRRSFDAGMVGLALSYALTVTADITMVIRSYCELQNQLVSVERIDEYLRKNPEPPAHLPADMDLPENWPQAGHIEFKNYSTRYRQGLDLVVKDISFEVQPAEKVGIVGRTGAGKSSLTLALFRIIEAANSHWAQASHNGPDLDTMPAKVVGDEDLEKVAVDEDGGSIWIDGVDISTVGLSRLRKNLAIIPQDPTLFAGTVRENLDPFEELEDADLWEALERSHLKEHISALAGGLSFKVSQNGDNFSVGQRSLICLARALLRKTKVLILDEATAAVDVETDKLIQKTIRKEFKDRTILTIAHRIKTVMDSDKILVLERGQVEEFEGPGKLVLNKESLFFKLALQAGEIKKEGNE